jgi:hypothetical protein
MFMLELLPSTIKLEESLEVADNELQTAFSQFNLSLTDLLYSVGIKKSMIAVEEVKVISSSQDQITNNLENLRRDFSELIKTLRPPPSASIDVQSPVIVSTEVENSELPRIDDENIVLEQDKEVVPRDHASSAVGDHLDIAASLPEQQRSDDLPVSLDFTHVDSSADQITSTQDLAQDSPELSSSVLVPSHPSENAYIPVCSEPTLLRFLETHNAELLRLVNLKPNNTDLKKSFWITGEDAFIFHHDAIGNGTSGDVYWVQIFQSMSYS